ncbi:maleylacetoacetate isomerase [Paracoccus beibuensis]|uniref:maleylacetoacetate isomerase n=1 Tax=Paracoccus beibuensis TaxID=547602 RepID=UPI00223ED3A1|nr:maleylacetoacetate isomerase [Paracoccus beibuensis]
MTVVLHDYWRSSASYRVRIALNLKGIQFERRPVDLVEGKQRDPAHLRLNPQGLVPALEIDGLVLTQSLAIIEYLDETRPGPRLLPADPAARTQARALSLAIACEIHPLSNLKTLNRIEVLAGKAARAAWNRDTIRAGLEAFERMLDHPSFTGTFCVGDAGSIADCVLIPQLYNASRWQVETDDLTRIAAVAARCKVEPTFVAAAPQQP